MQNQEVSTSGRFAGHDFSRLRRGFDVYIHFLGAAGATAEKLASEHEDRCSHDDHEDHQYRYDCCVTATTTTIVISHKSINPPLCADDSNLTANVIVYERGESMKQVEECPPSLPLGHSAYNHNDKAGRHGDRYFGFNR
jgi:hypothetical protein